MIEKRPYSWWIKQDARLRIQGHLPADLLIDYFECLSKDHDARKKEVDRMADFLIVNSFFSILCFWADRAINDGMDRHQFTFFMRLKILAFIEVGRFDDLDKLMESKSYDKHQRMWIHATICRLYSGQASGLLVGDEEYPMPYRDHGFDLDFWVLSLPSDIYRRTKLSGLLRYNSNTFAFFDGVRPTEIPLDDPVLNLAPGLRAYPELMLANFGSVYSTYLLYKHLLDSCTQDYYLIVQDDIVTLDSLRLDGPCGLAEALSQFELVFLNDRLKSSGPHVEPLQDALQWMDANDGIVKNAPGGDGYIIKRSALEKMLDYFEEHKISDIGVDWMLLMNSLSHEDLKRFKPGSIYRRMAERYRPYPPAQTRILACVLPRPLVKHAPRSTWNSWR